MVQQFGQTSVGGRISIEFENAPPMRITSLEGEGGLDLEVDTGMSMAMP